MTFLRDNLSIRAKLASIALAVGAVFCALVLGGNSGIHRLNESQRMELSLEKASGALQRTLRGLNEMVITEGSGTSKQAVQVSLKELDLALAQAGEALKGTPFDKGLSTRTLPLVEELKAKTAELLKYQEGEITLSSDAPIRAFGRAAKAGEKAVESLGDVHREVGEHSRSYGDSVLKALTAGAAVAALAVVVLFYLLYRTIVSPIRNIAAFAHRAAAGDFSSELVSNRKDEIGVLAEDLKGMSANLRGALTRLHSASDRLGANLNEANDELNRSSIEVGNSLSTYEVEIANVIETSRVLAEVTDEVVDRCEKLREVAGDSAQAIGVIVSSINEVSSLSDDHSNSAGHAANAVKTMLGQLSEISMNLTSLSSSTIEVASAITEMQANVESVQARSVESSQASVAVSDCARDRGLRSVADAETGIKRTHETVNLLASTIERLDERSKSISNIVYIIEDIAAQTSLLALNAAILAAQAGRYGDGFAIVANEIKALADRITSSTHEIGKVIRENNSETRASAQLSVAGREAAQDGIRLIGDVRGALEEIISQASNSAQLSKFIEVAMMEQSAGAMQISQATNLIANQVTVSSYAATELDRGSRTILDEMEKIRQGSAAIMEKTLGQKADTGRILHASGLVGTSADEITDRVTVARESAQNITRILDVLHTSTKTLADSVQNLSSRIQQVNSQSATVIKEINKFSV